MKEGTRVSYYKDRGTVAVSIPDYGVLVKFDDGQDVDFFSTHQMGELEVVKAPVNETAVTALEHLVKERDEAQASLASLLDSLEELLTRHKGTA